MLVKYQNAAIKGRLLVLQCHTSRHKTGLLFLTRAATEDKENPLPANAGTLAVGRTGPAQRCHFGN
jgi:hypothetical protein